MVTLLNVPLRMLREPEQAQRLNVRKFLERHERRTPGAADPGRISRALEFCAEGRPTASVQDL